MHLAHTWTSYFGWRFLVTDCIDDTDWIGPYDKLLLFFIHHAGFLSDLLSLVVTKEQLISIDPRRFCLSCLVLVLLIVACVKVLLAIWRNCIIFASSFAHQIITSPLRTNIPSWLPIPSIFNIHSHFFGAVLPYYCS